MQNEVYPSYLTTSINYQTLFFKLFAWFKKCNCAFWDNNTFAGLRISAFFRFTDPWLKRTKTA